MTHPPAGPSTPPPPSGPRFLPGRLSEYLRQIRADRANKAIQAEMAGAKGHAADPLHARRRERNYQRQNGTERLTARQRRRADHKANLAAKRVELAA